ncbi:MAG: enoyl-CoA hydratase/isomerase family protein [Sphingomonadales bacterium]|nr:MAG: enoyl-CoA hydratase/isomerase family protein [Sphingomonadales bacterium]
MVSLAEYQDKYRYIHLARSDDGVLTMRLHYNDGKFLWGFPQHEEVADCLLQIARDRHNKVVIVTGTGDVFLDAFEPIDDMAALFKPSFQEFCSHHLSVGHRLIQYHLDIEVPMIGVVNGPAGIHAELAVMCDIVLAADDAYFADSAHFPNGIAPGDGVHIVWPELLGVNRGRYFLLMGEKIYAEEAKRLGIVSEVMPRAQLADRAKEIATGLARHDPIMLRHTRAMLVQKLRKAVADLLPLGLHAAYGASMASAGVGNLGSAGD